MGYLDTLLTLRVHTGASVERGSAGQRLVRELGPVRMVVDLMDPWKLRLSHSGLRMSFELLPWTEHARVVGLRSVAEGSAAALGTVPGVLADLVRSPRWARISASGGCWVGQGVQWPGLVSTHLLDDAAMLLGEMVHLIGTPCEEADWRQEFEGNREVVWPAGLLAGRPLLSVKELHGLQNRVAPLSWWASRREFIAAWRRTHGGGDVSEDALRDMLTMMEQWPAEERLRAAASPEVFKASPSRWAKTLQELDTLVVPKDVPLASVAAALASWADEDPGAFVTRALREGHRDLATALVAHEDASGERLLALLREMSLCHGTELLRALGWVDSWERLHTFMMRLFRQGEPPSTWMMVFIQAVEAVPGPVPAALAASLTDGLALRVGDRTRMVRWFRRLQQGLADTDGLDDLQDAIIMWMSNTEVTELAVEMVNTLAVVGTGRCLETVRAGDSIFVTQSLREASQEAVMRIEERLGAGGLSLPVDAGGGVSVVDG